MFLLAGAALVCIVVALVGVLAAVDSGRLTPFLTQQASKRLQRTVAFGRIRTHLLSAHPTVVIQGLEVGDPAWAGRSNVLEAERMSLAFRWPDLLAGRFIPSEIELDKPRAALVRATRERNNWSSGNRRGGGDPFIAVKALRITGGSFSFDDRVRDLRLTGTLVHDPAAGAYPLSVVAEGVMKGGEIQLTARGGPLNARKRDAPYPFAADLKDGDSYLTVKGSTVRPLSLQGFDFDVQARGPNLANMEHLISVGLPNSRPYRLTGRLSRTGPTTRATGLKAVIGKSDFAGVIVSDGSRPRRLITIDLASQTLEASDIGAFLGSIPPHTVTRSTPGVAASGQGDRLLSSRPIDLTRFRKRDYHLKLSARRFIIADRPPGRLTAEGVMDRGRFEMKPLAIAFPSGRADAVIGLDVNGPAPAFRIDGTVRGPIGLILPSLATSMGGTSALRIDARGAGGSWRAVGLNARGRIAFSVRDGSLEKSRAKVLSGAVLQGAFAALSDKDARTPLQCAVADMTLGGGRLSGERMLMVTGSGAAAASGRINLADETIDMTIYGRPSGFRLFSVKAPVSISGPMLSPRTKVRLGGDPDPAGPPVKPPEVKGDRAAFCNQLLAGR